MFYNRTRKSNYRYAKLELASGKEETTMIIAGIKALGLVCGFAGWYWGGGGAEAIQNTIAYWLY